MGHGDVFAFRVQFSAGPYQRTATTDAKRALRSCLARHRELQDSCGEPCSTCASARLSSQKTVGGDVSFCEERRCCHTGSSHFLFPF